MFRCTAEEKATLERLAYDRHLSQSELLRALIAAAADEPETAPAVDWEAAFCAAAT